MRHSGLVAGGLTGLGLLSAGTVRKATAGAPAAAAVEVTLRKNVCTHCSVGCSVIAKVANEVWIGQEPDFSSPINRGSHCCKGAAVRDDVIGERRLRYPVKLVEGQWQRIPWDQAIAEIGDKLLAIRAQAGPDSVYWLGSAKFTNEAAYLFRKLAAFWGTNNADHQARICHSTTVTGVANTWGYGAMTNSYNDIRNARTIMVMGGNPAEAHPVSLQHILEGKEINRANMIVIDPRMTRTAAHATEYVRVRPGTHIATIYGMMWHILQNGWEDKEYIRQRVYGLDDVRAEIEKWTPEEVERVTGLPEAQVKRVAEIFAKQRPATLIWAMGQTQFTTGTANVRASCLLLLLTGNVGLSGSGANILPWPYQRSGRDRPRPGRHHAATVLRSFGGCLAALVQGLGSRLRLDPRTLSRQDPDGDTRNSQHALVRCDVAAKGGSQPAQPGAGHVRHGAWRQHHHPDARVGQGNGEARSPGRLRPLSDHLVCVVGAA